MASSIISSSLARDRLRRGVFGVSTSSAFPGCDHAKSFAQEQRRSRVTVFRSGALAPTGVVAGTRCHQLQLFLKTLLRFRISCAGSALRTSTEHVAPPEN